MSTIKGDLRAQLAAARRQEDVPQRRLQEAGHVLLVTQARNGDVVVVLERAGVEPEQGQWDRVLANWPEPVPDDVVPTKRKEGRRRVWVGRWPRPAATPEIPTAAVDQA